MSVVEMLAVSELLLCARLAEIAPLFATHEQTIAALLNGALALP